MSDITIIRYDLNDDVNKDLPILHPQFKNYEIWEKYDKIWLKHCAFKVDGTSKIYYDYDIVCKKCKTKMSFSESKRHRKFFYGHSIECSDSSVKRYRRDESNKSEPQFGAIDMLAKRAKTMTTSMQDLLMSKIVDLSIVSGVPFSFFELAEFYELFDVCKFKVGKINSSKIHDSIIRQGSNYRINLHEKLQKVPSVSLVIDLWQSGDKNSTWFLCCGVMYIDEDFKSHCHLLCFQALEEDHHSPEYLSKVMKQIAIDYNIIYKINNIILDSATNNLKFGDVFYEEINNTLVDNPHKKKYQKSFKF